MHSGCQFFCFRSRVWYNGHSGKSWMIVCVPAHVCVCVCMCTCVYVLGWGLGWMELWVDTVVKQSFSLYVAASHMAHVRYICVCDIYFTTKTGQKKQQ